ncbi:MAG TPA: OsmC family protein, partial [Xanthomonadaceae bacterium]|nr:OsmC family protein [Xanthomonadaceae bacterium]
DSNATLSASPDMELDMIRKANANWKGAGKDGKGHLKTQSGALDAPYGFNSRFEDGAGSNPEELLAAAHAGCFTMSVAFALERAGHPAEDLTCECEVSVIKEGGGFTINRSALTLKAKVPGMMKEAFEPLVQGAKAGCPVSKLFATEILLEWTLG